MAGWLSGWLAGWAAGPCPLCMGQRVWNLLSATRLSSSPDEPSCPCRTPRHAQAKADAAAAKAAGSKERQKACGQAIGQLRQEMQQLGITDAELEDAAPAAPTPAPEAVRQQQQQQQQQDEPGEAAVEPSAADDDGGASAEAAQAPAGGDGDACDSGGSSSSEDEAPPDFDLFGDGSALEGAEVVRAKKSRAQRLAEAAAATAAAMQPWGAGAGGGKGKKGGKQQGKAAAAAAPEPQQPKALLQQHCQRCGWAAPRFERLAHGGLRLEGGGYRYSATVEAGGGKGPKRRQQQQQGGAPAGPRAFSLREADDGWERIEARRGCLG